MFLRIALRILAKRPDDRIPCIGKNHGCPVLLVPGSRLLTSLMVALLNENRFRMLKSDVISTRRVVLKARRALPFFSRHPWVFQGAVDWLVGDPQPGDVVDVIDDAERFVARGLFNPQSQICVRLYSWDEAVPLDEAFWSQRLDDAIALRRGLFGVSEETINNRSTGEPGGVSPRTLWTKSPALEARSVSKGV